MTLRPDHISVYPLQLEEGTPLARLEEQGRIAVPDEDFQAVCMDLAAEKLAGAGFERYEVASYAQLGQRCRHNIAYWTGKPYLGLGRSAAGMTSRCTPFSSRRARRLRVWRSRVALRSPMRIFRPYAWTLPPRS